MRVKIKDIKYDNLSHSKNSIDLFATVGQLSNSILRIFLLVLTFRPFILTLQINFGKVCC